MTLTIQQRAILRKRGVLVLIERGDGAQKMTPAAVRELLDYDPETGIFAWRERGDEWFGDRRSWKTWNTRFAGNRAGSAWTDPKTGYRLRVIKLMSANYPEHRLAWMWMTDDPLPPQIDHENRDATDNRWRNLRASNSAKNARNKSMYRINKSGVTGVSWDKAGRKWIARVRVNDELHRLGRFAELDEAAMEVMEFRAGHGFDPQHGLEFAPRLREDI